MALPLLMPVEVPSLSRMARMFLKKTGNLESMATLSFLLALSLVSVIHPLSVSFLWEPVRGVTSMRVVGVTMTS